MDLKKKKILGLFSILPLLISIIGSILFRVLPLDIFLAYFQQQPLIVVLVILTSVMGAYVFWLCISHALKTNRFSPLAKIIWVIVLFFFNIISMPIYFYLYIWKEPLAPRMQQADRSSA
jgi:hypothetical protein